MAWFSGTHEGADDVSIVVSLLPVGTSQWTNASLVSRREGYSNQNPVLHYEDGAAGTTGLCVGPAAAKVGPPSGE